MNDLVTASVVRDFLLQHYREKIAELGLDSTEFPDDFDLFAQEVIDSMGILEMVAALNARFEVSLDFESMEEGSLTEIGPLSRFVEAQVQLAANGVEPVGR